MVGAVRGTKEDPKHQKPEEQEERTFDHGHVLSQTAHGARVERRELERMFQ